MVAANFDQSFKLVLKNEGGYVNNKHDPGGETNYGITRRVYDAYRIARHLNTQSVRYISMPEVSEIFRLQYWDACKCDALPPGVDYAVYDYAVNSGCVRAAKGLQRAIPTEPVDGHIGLGTIAAAKAASPGAVVLRLCTARLGFLHSLGTWKFFGKGWANRMRDVQAAALQMAKAG